MEKSRLISGWILCCVLLSACSEEIFPEKGSNELAALGYLREFQTANAVFLTEHGRYASLTELYRASSGSLIDYELFMAWDGHEESRPLFGHLFAGIDPGYASRRGEGARSGLCAYPTEPGKSGDLIICTLTDSGHAESESVGEESTEVWHFYVAQVSKVRHPPRAWPSNAELEKSFERLDGRTPEQGIADARPQVTDAAGGG